MIPADSPASTAHVLSQQCSKYYSQLDFLTLLLLKHKLSVCISYLHCFCDDKYMAESSLREEGLTLTRDMVSRAREAMVATA